MSLIFAEETAAPASGYRPSAALAALVLFMVAGQMHAFVAPYAPDAATGQALAPPGMLHLLGTDVVGRDLFSETLHALGVTVHAILIALFFVLFPGHLAGLVAAHLLGKAGFVLRVGANVLCALPALLLAILFAALLVPGGAPIAAGFAVAPHAFLLSYDRARTVLAAPYSDYARASGVSEIALLMRDLRHELRALIALAARAIAAVTVIFSTMSFFGFGAKPPARDLGLMIASARADLPEAWWTAAIPAFALILFILAARLVSGLESDRA
jgi:peptide/nickel transport system permease protein